MQQTRLPSTFSSLTLLELAELSIVKAQILGRRLEVLPTPPPLLLHTLCTGRRRQERGATTPRRRRNTKQRLLLALLLSRALLGIRPLPSPLQPAQVYAYCLALLQAEIALRLLGLGLRLCLCARRPSLLWLEPKRLARILQRNAEIECLAPFLEAHAQHGFAALAHHRDGEEAAAVQRLFDCALACVGGSGEEVAGLGVLEEDVGGHFFVAVFALWWDRRLYDAYPCSEDLHLVVVRGPARGLVPLCGGCGGNLVDVDFGRDEEDALNCARGQRLPCEGVVVHLAWISLSLCMALQPVVMSRISRASRCCSLEC